MGSAMHVWIGRGVPSNDGGISLGQAALAAAAHSTFSLGRHHMREADPQSQPLFF